MRFIKKTSFPVLLLLCWGISLAQVPYPSWSALECNSLDGLTVGSLAESGSDFWLNFPEAESDALVTSEQTFTGNRAIRLARPNANYFDDVVYYLDSPTSGRYRIEWHMFLPTGSAATAGLINDFDGTGGPGSNWAYRIEFDGNGQATVLLGQSSTELSTISYPRGRWFRVAQVVDLGSDFVRMFIDNIHVADWSLSEGEDSPGNLSLDVVNIWAKIGTDLPTSQSPIYIDNMCVSLRDDGVIVDCFEPNPACLIDEDLFNECVGLQQGFIEGEWTLGSCEGGGDGNICTDAIDLPCNTTYLGSNASSGNNYTNEDYGCASSSIFYNGNDQVFRISHPGGRFVASLLNPGGVDLDMFLLQDAICDGDEAFGLEEGRLLPGCITISDNFGGGAINQEVIYFENLDPATYYLVIDGRTSDDIGSYELALSCEFNCTNSEIELSCGATLNDRVPSREEQPFGNFTSNYCANTSTGGGTGATANERAFRVNITEAGSYTFNLGVPNGSSADFQLVLLNSVNVVNGPGESCGLFDDCVGIAANSGSGESESLTLFLQPNEYWLIVDGFNSSFGDFTVSMNCDGGSECDNPNYSDDPSFVAILLPDGRYGFSGIQGDFSTEDSYQIGFSDINNSGFAFTGNGTANLTVDFGDESRAHVVCYPYRDLNGCLNYRCTRLCIEPDDEPLRFQVQDQPQNERFRLLLSALPPPNNGGVSQVTWFYYDDGETVNIGTNVSVFIPYPEVCYTRTFYVRYFDNSSECFRTERRTIEVCPPQNCPDPVFNQSCGNQTLTLSTNGDYRIQAAGDVNTNLPWLFNREPRAGNPGGGITLDGNVSHDVEICYPVTDANGCTSYCCRQYCLDGLDNSPQVLYEFDSETNAYQFELEEDNAIVNPQWISLDDSGPPISGSGATASVPTPSNCITQTYYVRYRSNGCWRIARRTVYICDPYACEGIGYQYIAENNTFSLSIESEFDENQPLAWVDDDTGESLGTSSTIPVPVPPGDCQFRNISVRYYDANRRAWVICCRTIYLCDPNQCDGILYQYSPEAQAFDLSIEGADPTEPIAWVDDDTGGDLGTGASIPVPAPPGTCVTRNISVRYYDSFRQGWVICCRSIYLCTPASCEDRINFSYGNGNAVVTANIGDGNRNWFVNGTPSGSGASLAVPLSEGQSAEVCVQYFDTAVGGFRTCCKEITIPSCELPFTNFVFVQNDEQTIALNTSEETAVSAYNWEVDGESIGTSRDLTLNLPPGTYILCLTVTNSCGSQRFCRTVTIPNRDTDLVLRPLPGVCGAPGEVVDIPIYADNFTDILNYQITIGLTDTTVAKIIGLELENIPGVEDFLIYNGARAAVIWDNGTGLFFPDGTLLMTLKVAIQNGGPLTSDVLIASGPVPSYAENGNGEEITISMVRGTVGPCSEVEVSGFLFNDRGRGIARATVSLHRNGLIIDQVITDASGSYGFLVIPDGANYTIRPSKLINYRNHVNSGDLSAVRRHIFGTAPLMSPYRRIAADVTNIGSINSGDISSIRQLVFGLIPAFPGIPSWEFVPENHVFPNPDTPTGSSYPREINLGRVSGNQSGLNFIGLKMGDPSSGADPENARPDGPTSASRSANDLSFMVGDTPPVRGVPWELDVYAYNFTEMLATQFSMGWDPEVIDLIEIMNENTTLGIREDNFSLAEARDGKLPWLWFAEENAVSLPDSSLLFTLRFNIIGEVGDTATVSFTEMPTEFFFENTGGEIAAGFGDKEQIVELFTSTSTMNEIDQIRVYPNPTSSAFFVDHQSQRSVDVNLYNLQGKLLKTWPQSRGNNRFGVEDLPAGVYLVSLRLEDRVSMRRVMIRR